MTAPIERLRFKRTHAPQAVPDDLVDIYWSEEAGSLVTKDQDGAETPVGADAASFATAAQGALADSALQSVAAADITDAGATGIDLVQSATPAEAREEMGLGEPVYADLVADGVADDTVALQAALDLAGTAGRSQIVWLPVGTIKITAELEIKNRVWLMGHGYEKTIIQATTPGQNGFWFNSGDHDNCRFKGFKLIGPDTTTGDGVATGCAFLLDHKTLPGTYVFGPVDFEDVWVSTWFMGLKIGQVPLSSAKHMTLVGNKNHISMISTDTFHFDLCSIGAGGVYLAPAGALSIKIQTSAVAPASTNFAGVFSNCEIGNTWKFLDLLGGRVAFESCNFETHGSIDGANALFNVAAGQFLSMKNCRFGLATVTADAGTTAAATIALDATNASAAPYLYLENNQNMTGSAYPTPVKMVGDSWPLYDAWIFGDPVKIKYYNTAGTEQAEIARQSSTLGIRGRGYTSSVAASHAASVTRRGHLFEMWVEGTTNVDDDLLFTRRTRFNLSGVRQYTRSSLVNDMLMEVIGASVAITPNTSGSGLNITAGRPTIGIGTLKGSGDVITLIARGTCAANANVKTFSAYLDTEKVATRITITDATAVYWECSLTSYGVLNSTAKMVIALTAYDAAGLQVHNKKINVDQAGWTSVDFPYGIFGQSATANDIICHGWDCTWRTNATKQ